jgi:hypothetical protein
VKPVQRLNVVVNRLCVEKPVASATSASDAEDAANKRVAYSIRRCSTNVRGVCPQIS